MATAAPTSDALDPVDVAFEDKPLDEIADDPNGQRCPPNSSLLLNLEQEGKLTKFICDVISDMQRDNEEWIKKRDNWIQEHENDFRHRVHAGTTFTRSNSSFNQSRRNAIPIIARLTKDYLGTDPFFAVKPVRKVGSTVEADDVQAYAEFKSLRARLKESLEDGIDMGAVVGERVEMITFEKHISISKEKANVLIDPQTGQPKRDYKDRPIYDYDIWVDSSYFQTPTDEQADQKPGQPGTPVPAPTPENFVQSLGLKLMQWGKKTRQAPVKPAPTGTFVLKKDPNITADGTQGVGPTAGASDPVTNQVIPHAGTYKLTLVDKADVRFSGAKVTGIAHGDFYCPLNEPDIQDSPYIARVFDMTVPEIMERYYMAVDIANLDPQEKLFYALLGDKLKLLEGEDAMPKSDFGKPDHKDEEIVSPKSDTYNKRVKLAEIYLRADPDGTGFQKEIMAVVALDQKFLLFYDYTDNVTSPGVGRPFRIIRVTPKRGRWWGISEYKLNEHKQRFIDWCLNEVVYANAVDGKFVLYDPEAAEGWDAQEPQPGERLHKMKRKSDPEKTPAIQYYTPPEVPKDLLELMKNMMQSAQAERGNLSPGGDSMQDLPSSKLKYGIQAIQQAGDEVYALSAMNCARGMTDVIDAWLRTTLDNMDATEEYRFTEGDNFLTASIDRADIEDMDMDISLEMTLTRGDQIYQQNDMADQLMSGYLMKLPCDQQYVRSFVVGRLKAMDIQNAEKDVPEPTPEDIQLSLAAKRASWQMQAQQGQPPVQPGAPGGMPAAAPGGSAPGQPPTPAQPAPRI